jgi:hypothetical protein
MESSNSGDHEHQESPWHGADYGYGKPFEESFTVAQPRHPQQQPLQSYFDGFEPNSNTQLIGVPDCSDFGPGLHFPEDLSNPRFLTSHEFEIQTGLYDNQSSTNLTESLQGGLVPSGSPIGSELSITSRASSSARLDALLDALPIDNTPTQTNAAQHILQDLNPNLNHREWTDESSSNPKRPRSSRSTGQKPRASNSRYPCTQDGCGATFTRAHGVTRHVNTIHKKELSMCGWCQNSNAEPKRCRLDKVQEHGQKHHNWPKQQRMIFCEEPKCAQLAFPSAACLFLHNVRDHGYKEKSYLRFGSSSES